MLSSINIKRFGVIGTITLLFCLPMFSIAQNTSPSPAETGGTGITYVCNHGTPGECNFNDLVAAIKKVVNWGTLFAIQFCIVVIAWAGFNYMISGDNAGARTKANKALWNVVIGMIFILAAWLIVTLILRVLGATSVVQLG